MKKIKLLKQKKMRPVKHLKTLRNGTVHFVRTQLLFNKVITYILYFPSEKMTIHENDPSDWHQFTEEIKAVSNNPENRSRQSKTS